jgi:aminoglycoside phosphotransferase (APT) family kinase protein
MAREAEVMKAARRFGLAVPEVLLYDAGDQLETAGLIMTRVPGETIARRILREDEFAKARELLCRQLGEFLGGLHSIDTDEVPDLEGGDPLEGLWLSYTTSPDRSPTFEAAHEWLLANRPASPARVIVHGDLRLGNIIVGADGLNAAIDWELVHIGDPLEDLAWLCTKAWRFGSPLPVAGVGELAELFDAYESASGRVVDRQAFDWWLVLATLKWGIACMAQAAAHLSGAVRSIELAAVGRRVAEQEWDLLGLLAPEEVAKVLDERREDAIDDVPGLYGRPTARELLDAVRSYLMDDVMPATEGRLSFHARVAANVVAIVERELAMGESHRARWSGATDWASLASMVRDKLSVANPMHLER